MKQLNYILLFIFSFLLRSTLVSATEMVAGKDVKIEVEAIFSGTSQRPDAFEVRYWIDGVKTERTFINQ